MENLDNLVWVVYFIDVVLGWDMLTIGDLFLGTALVCIPLSLEVIKSPEVQELGGKGVEVLNKVMDEYLSEDLTHHTTTVVGG